MSDTVSRFLSTVPPIVMPTKGELVVVETSQTLSGEIRKEHGKVMGALADSLTAAIAAGKHLLKAKALLKQEKGHGLWQDYVGIECGLSLSTAQNYMRLAKYEVQLAPLLSANTQNSGFLSQAQALRFLGDERKKRKRRKANSAAT
jgi:hypothetical protein